MRGPRLTRRTLLRGLGGTAVALPWLEAMEPAHAADAPPTRYLVFFGGISLGNARIPSPNLLAPPTAAYTLTAQAQALSAFQQDVSIVSGLRIPVQAEGEATPPAGRSRAGDSFHTHLNPLLSGVHQLGADTDVRVTSPSSDQLMAEVLGKDTLHASLSLRVQASPYSGDQAERLTPSFRRVGDAVVPVEAYTSPRRLFDVLTSDVVPSDPVAAARRQAELTRRRSVLDLVDRRMDGVLATLGTADKARVDRHLTELRELELRLAAKPALEGGACRLPTGFEDPALDFAAGWSEEERRADLFDQLVRFAFACDLTRVGAYMLTTWQSQLQMGPLFGIPMSQHTVHHEGTTGELRPIVSWHVTRFAKLLAQLADTEEGTGSVLDHTAALFVVEGGYGPYLGNQEAFGSWSSHSTDNMVVLVAGHAGGLKGGQHVVARPGADHPGNVLLTAMQAAGSTADRLGEVQGTIPELLG